ncbi:polysaccharide biosynthesis domain containing protein 1 [Quaeritorhiza haematococci]|nr:polysaccharide biosynthesis domain containing protein 1 [Quaeritorhiza haematococci]
MSSLHFQGIFGAPQSDLHELTAFGLEDIEKQWAVKALHHAETYFKLISAVDAARLKLTPIDDEIYEDFRKNFAEINVAALNEMEEFKTEKAKAKWRDFIMRYEKKVQDYNFGTLLRIRSNEDYGPDNGFFVTRLQFYAIEIARNKENLNSMHSQKSKN